MRVLYLRGASDREAEELRSSMVSEPFSYGTGILDGQAPSGMSDDRLDVVLGIGDEAWKRARRALDEWTHFDLPWAGVATGGGPAQPGQAVVVHARRLGIHMRVACRVLETHDTVGADRLAYGFTYGSLRNHIERGEESFEVWHDLASDEVGYTIHAMAAPGRWYSRLAKPLVDHYRGQFRHDSAEAMAKAVVG
ncbi:MAG: DUF1990 domain-containing protein [bacterium]|nr:DUF1990 domain-containing protein [bacterium]